MRTITLLLVLTFGGLAVETDRTEVELVLFAEGFAAPLAIVQAPDDSGRFFVVDQPGRIWILDGSGTMRDRPFLDISDQILELEENYDERGLLGLAFHPDYAENGRFYVYFSAEASDTAPEEWDHTSHVDEFTVSEDPNLADPDSQRPIFSIDQPYHNHNAGQIAFGPDGYLYIPLGDGGNGGDIDAADDDRGRPEAGWAQTLDSLLGSILRIDIDDGDPYGIPDDNPLLDVEEIPDEVYAYGFRNPYGMSFDLETGDLYIADAGQALWEEVSRVVPGGNHGWRIREGTHCFDPDNFIVSLDTCPDTGPRGEPLVDPVIEYPRGPATGSVIIPGILARDPDVPSLEGRFVFGDYATIRFIPTGIIYAATEEEDDLWPVETVTVVPAGDRPRGGLDRFLLGINQDLSGRLYVLTTQRGGPAGSTGEIYRITEPGAEESSGWIQTALITASVVVAGAMILLGVTARGWFRREGSP